MFRIRKAGNGQVVFTLSGRIEADDLAEIRQQLAQETGMGAVVLDLRDVTLVNEGAVEFLVRCEATNISLQRCPGYIRKWMKQSKEATMSVKR
jgi:STAS domain